MSRLIPPIGTRGRYTLTQPWQVDGTILYTCAAIRSFRDVENLGTDIFTTYYEPKNLTRNDMERDRRDNQMIVTLVSDTTAPVYVPSSYIAQYPDLNHYDYQHVVLSASLGTLPDYIDLSFLKDQVAGVISDTVGATPEVFVNVAPFNGVVSPTQHEVIEATRQQAITNRTTDRAKVLELQAKNEALEDRLTVLEQILRDEGVLPS